MKSACMAIGMIGPAACRHNEILDQFFTARDAMTNDLSTETTSSDASIQNLLTERNKVDTSSNDITGTDDQETHGATEPSYSYESPDPVPVPPPEVPVSSYIASYSPSAEPSYAFSYDQAPERSYTGESSYTSPSYEHSTEVNGGDTSDTTDSSYTYIGYVPS